MNKRIFALVAILAAPSFAFAAEQEMTDAQIEQAYRQAALEQGRYDKARRVGAVAGIIPGSQAAHSLAARHVSIGLTGAYAGSQLGSEVGGRAAAMYYARKYGVSTAIAELALITQEPLSLPKIKNAFINAEKQNYQELKSFIISYFQKNFGNNWLTDIKNMINKSMKQAKLYNDNDAINMTRKTQTGRRFVEASWFMWALSTLYFKKRVFFASTDFKTRIEATNNLLEALEIIE